MGIWSSWRGFAQVLIVKCRGCLRRCMAWNRLPGHEINYCRQSWKLLGGYRVMQTPQLVLSASQWWGGGGNCINVCGRMSTLLRGRNCPLRDHKRFVSGRLDVGRPGFTSTGHQCAQMNTTTMTWMSPQQIYTSFDSFNEWIFKCNIGVKQPSKHPLCTPSMRGLSGLQVVVACCFASWLYHAVITVMFTFALRSSWTARFFRSKADSICTCYRSRKRIRTGLVKHAETWRSFR